MNLIQQFGPRDESSTPATDLKFAGVDERQPASVVDPGYLCGARNCRFRNGRLEPRDGIALLPWMKGNGLTPFTETYGGGVFADPNQSGEWILIAAEGGVWKTRPNRVATPVALPDGVVLTQATFKKFIQANAAIVMLRGFNEDPLVCYDLEQGFQRIAKADTWAVLFDHATNLVQLAGHGFLVGDAIQFDVADSALIATAPELTGTQTIGQNTPPPQITIGQTYYVGDVPDPDHFTVVTAGDTQVIWNIGTDDTACDIGAVTALDGASEIPPAENGIFWANRLYLINGKDTLLQSDIGDFTRYAPIPDTFRINQGDAFTLLALRMMNEATMLFFKSGNVQKALGVGSDITQAQGPLNVTDEYGIAGPEAHCLRGNDVYFLTNELRVSSITLTELNKEQNSPEHLSDPLIKTFGRINAGASARCRMTSFEEYLFVALPVDDAKVISQVESVPAGATFGGGGLLSVAVTAGQRYQWTQGTNTFKLVNGSETLKGDAEFIAQGATVTLWESADGAVLDSIRAVIAEDVCNAVAVYDFQRQAWCGTDESTRGSVCVRDWIKFTYGGRTRLAFIGADGWLHLYGESWEDEVLQTNPAYVDVLWDPPSILVPPPYTIRIDALEAKNVSSVATLQAAYDAGSAPGYTITTIADGIRIVRDDGAVAAIYVNGVATPASGNISWALLDTVGAQVIAPVGIEQYALTRGYLCMRPYTLQNGLQAKRFVCLALQLATWDPSYTVRTIMQGKGTEADQVTAETRDRLQYFDQFDKLAWDPSNTNDDYNAPGREDYSWAENGSGMKLGSGVDIDGHQEFVHRLPVNERGLWMQVEITNTQGRLELVAAAMEALEGEVLGGVSVN